MLKDKKTYGQLVSEHSGKNLTLDDDVIEYRKAMEPTLLNDLKMTAEKAAASSSYKNKNFYVVVLFKVERIGQAPRTFVFARHSCPTPTYKQAVWKYHHVSGALEFLFSIPDKILYYHIFRNAQKYLADKECSDLAKYVLLMESGELLQWVKRENGEKIDAVIKIQEAVS